jgi:hypothetical protein
MSDKPKPLNENHHERAAQSMENFVLYVSSPWRVIWVNFIAGIFRGLGTIIGASIVIAAIIWIVSLFTKVPLVGQYAQDIEDVVTGYVRETNYNDELGRVGDTLDRIEQALKQQSLENSSLDQ